MTRFNETHPKRPTKKKKEYDMLDYTHTHTQKDNKKGDKTIYTLIKKTKKQPQPLWDSNP